MRSMRVLGNMIEKLAHQNNCTLEAMGEVLDCTPAQIKAMYKGRVFPSFEQLSKLADFFATTVECILNGDAEHYEKSVVHCMEDFENTEHREFILDIIDDYLRLKEAVNP